MPSLRRAVPAACLALLAAILPAVASAAAPRLVPHSQRGSALSVTYELPFGATPRRADLLVAGLRLENRGGDLVLRATRTHGRVAITQDTSGAPHRVVTVSATKRRPYTIADGLPDAVSIELSQHGHAKLRTTMAWCPRLGGEAPSSCGDPLSRMSVWRILHGRTVAIGGVVRGVRGVRVLPAGRYDVTVRIDPARHLRLAKAVVWHGIANVRSGRTREGGISPAPKPGHIVPTPVFDDQPAPLGDVAGIALPDLLPLPAEHMAILHSGSRDELRFDGDVADVGADLVVHGARAAGDPARSMIATQVLSGPSATVLHPAGHLVYDEGDGHDHWHFDGLARYRLLRAGTHVQVGESTKVGFCFGDTAPYDLSVPGAQIAPKVPPLHVRACERKHPEAATANMRLTSGWIDAYTQNLDGQAFDVTKLPNGRYELVIGVNEHGLLAETTTANNTSTRTLVLGGKRGHRTVRVPPVDGVDTEQHAG